MASQRRQEREGKEKQQEEAKVWYCIGDLSISVQCSAVQCSAVQCGAVQCSAVQCRDLAMPVETNVLGKSPVFRPHVFGILPVFLDFIYIYVIHPCI